MAAGPWIGSLLGELGADVIKIEPPAGDGTRWVEPLQRGMGTNYMCLNVNKRSVVLDLKAEEGRNAALELLRSADVFIQNFRGGVIDRLGLGYDVLHSLNPQLVYCSVSGFGEEGPLANEACADFIMQAYSGFARLNGCPGDEFEAFRFTGFIDLTTSIVAVEAVLAALLDRDKAGKGQKVEVSMLKSAMEMQSTRMAELLGADEEPGPRGSNSPNLMPDGAYQALDGEIFLTVHNDRQWKGFCAALEQADLADDSRFASNALRLSNGDVLDAILTPIFAARPMIWWMRALERAGVPCALAQNFETLRYHSQVRDNGMIAEIDTQEWGRVLVGGLPWHFSKTPGMILPPPVPGGATESVLDELRRRSPADFQEVGGS
jgi:formyl-CoA transferase